MVNLHSNIADIYAARLFGGSYILCLYLGMLFGKYYGGMLGTDKWKKIFFSAASLLMAIIMIYVLYAKGFVLDDYAALGSVVNPPGATLIVYALAVMLAIFFLDNLISSSGLGVLNALEISAAYIGKQTLYIFLYHMLFLQGLNGLFGQLPLCMKVPFYYLAMVFGSIFMGCVYKVLKKLVIQSYLYGEDKTDGKNHAKPPGQGVL